MSFRKFGFVAVLAFAATSPLLGQDDGSEIDPEFLDNLLESIDDPEEGTTGPEASFLLRPVNQIDEQLRTASTALAAGDFGSAAQMAQQKALEMMQALLPDSQSQDSIRQQNRQTNEQQQQTRQRNPSENESAPRESEDEKAGGVDGQPGNETGEKASVKVSLGPADLIKGDIWGHLPERTRGQLRATTPGQFLPAYREAISTYYRILAEQSAERRPER